MQADRFQQHLLEDGTDIINKLIHIKTQHANKDVRERADLALSAVFHQVFATTMASEDRLIYLCFRIIWQCHVLCYMAAVASWSSCMLVHNGCSCSIQLRLTTKQVPSALLPASMSVTFSTIVTVQ